MTHPPRTIARRITAGFGLVGLVVLIMCAVQGFAIASIARTVHGMQEDEATVRDSLGLAMAIREQYIHQAHVIIEDETHLGHYSTWVARAQRGVHALRPRIDSSERWRLDRVRSESVHLDALFRTEILPALERDDRVRVSKLHRDAEKLAERAVSDADAVARQAEAQMNRHHAEAISLARLGLTASGGCLAVVVVLSAVYSVWIRRSVLNPLRALSWAAEQAGRGEFDVRLGKVGEGELQAVADAYDRMAEELRTREERLLRSERMAVIGQLAAGIAHEINNPIGVIRGYLRTIDHGGLPDTLREELRIVDEEAAACQRIAEDLLAYARSAELSVDVVQVDELLLETVRRFVDSGEAAITR